MHFVGKVDPAPRNAILVDDVFTTGATLSRCAELLKAHGTEEVGALVFVMEEE
jgi:predicted amidophosphoribosyltransferase